MKANKKSLAKIILCLAMVLSLFGATFTMLLNSKTAKASDTVAMDDGISFTVDDGYYGAVAINVEFADFTVDYYDWHLESDFSFNNDVDPLAYTLINGKSAREIYEEDDSSLEIFTADWVGDCGAYVVTVYDTYANAGEFTMQLKAGFTLVDYDGVVHVLENDTAVYGWTNGTFGEVVEEEEPVAPAEGLEYSEYIGIEDRTSWASGGHADIVTLGLMDFSITEGAQYFKSSVSGCWYKGNDGVTTANNGLDILEYVYLNGVSARALLDGNTEGKVTANTGYWLSNPAAWPIAFETGADCWIRIDKTAFEGGNFTFTLKAGFALIRNDGVRIYLTNDVTYAYTNGVLGEKTIGATETPDEPVIPEAIDITERLAMEDRAWGAHEDEVYVALLDMGIDNGGNNWFNTHEDVSSVWNVDDPSYAQRVITNNGGLNILDYIYVNGESVSSLRAKNLSGELNYKGKDGWTTRADCSPVFVESTVGSGLIIKIIKDFSTTQFTITIKAGFTIKNLAGDIVTVTKDIDFDYNNGVITKTVKNDEPTPDPDPIIPEAIDITERLAMEDRAWGAHDGEVYVALLDMGIDNGGNNYFHTHESVQGTWNVGNDDIIVANNGLDIMQYILVNGITARSLIDANANGDRLSNACSCWLSNPAAYPVYVETTTHSGLMIRVAKAHVGTQFTITIKAGLTIKNLAGDVVTISKDIDFSYNNGVITKAIAPEVYTLSFECSEASIGSITVKEGLAIDNLPAVPEKEGYVGVWTIDGVEISSATLYTYGADKTAVAVYTEVEVLPEVDITDRISMEDRSWGAKDYEVYVALLDMGVNNATGGSHWLNTREDVSTVWNVDDPSYAQRAISNNGGLNILDYIYINGVSASTLRAMNLSGELNYRGQSGEWNERADCCPIFVESTIGSGLIIKIIKDYSTTSFVLTIKAGFSIINTQNERVFLSRDVNFAYNNGIVSKAYVLSFECSEGWVDSIYAIADQAMTNLPTVPAKEGFAGVWTIDGVDVNSNTVYTYGEDKVAIAKYVQKDFVLSFECDEPVDSIQVELGGVMSNLPEVPVKAGYEGYWTIDGVKVTAETVYSYASDKVAVAEYIAVVDITGRIEIEDRSWGVHCADELYVALLDMGITNVKDGSENHWLNTDASVNGCWYSVNRELIAANGGVDIVDYIYINGKSARVIIDENRHSESPLTACTCWLSNPAASPIYVESTLDSGLMIRFAKAYTGTEFTITIKAGFTITNANGQKVFLSEDVHFLYSNGKVGRAYTLSFEGATEDVDSIVVGYGISMSNLPAVPEKEGFAGRWTIDGVTVTAETIFEYDCDKVAVAEYYQKYFELSFEGVELDPITVEVEMPMANLPEVPAKEGYIAYWTIDGVIVDANTVYSFAEDKVVVANYFLTVDISDVLLAEDWGSPAGMDDLTYIRIGIERDDMGNLIIPTAFALHWNDHLEAADGNFGVDIMDYIYVTKDGVSMSARDLVNLNANERVYVGITEPFSYGGIFCPIDVQTQGGEFYLWILKDFADRYEFEITFKAGLMIKANKDLGVVYVLSKDVTFYYGDLDDDKFFGRDFSMTFEGTEEVRDLFYGEALGELPAVPEKAGYTGVWTVNGEVITAETVFADKCNLTAVVEYAPIDYTITIQRANGNAEEIIFNADTRVEILASIALTESNLFYAYSWQEALPEILDFTDYTFVEIRTELPASTRIISYSLSIDTAFNFNVFVEVVGNDVPVMTFTMGEREVTVEGVVVDANSGKYVFTFLGIEAYNLAEEFTASLAVGEDVIDTLVFSVEEYLVQLAKTDISDELKTLVADVIAYAKAAEEYVGKDVGIQPIEGLTATEYVDLTSSDVKKTESKDFDVYITSQMVKFDDNGNIVVLFVADSVEDVTVKINGVEAQFSPVEDALNIYEVSSEALFVTNANVRYTFEIFVGETKVQTLTYNLKSYLYEIQAKDDAMSKLLKSIYNLSLSAKAYSEGE